MNRKIIWLVFISFFFIVIDQLLKSLSFRYFTGGFFLFGKFFGLDFYQNYGVAFGLRLPPFLFYILVAFILYFIFEKFKKEIQARNFFILFALALILAGAIGNLIDRIFRGYVIDYFYLYPMSYFNLADVAILAGVGMVGWRELKLKV